MSNEDYIAKLLTGRELDAPEKAKAKGKKLREEASTFGFGYVKY